MKSAEIEFRYVKSYVKVERINGKQGEVVLIAGSGENGNTEKFRCCMKKTVSV